MEKRWMEKLIIDVRVNEYTFRDPNPNVPYSPEEIARDAAECRAAGASIVHYHARDPVSGAPSADAGLYADTARRIRAACDAIVLPTLGAGTIPDLDERFAHVDEMARSADTRAEMIPLDLATLNLPIWSPGDASVGGDDLAYHNTVGALKLLADRARRAGSVPMAAIWNVASLRLLEAFVETGVLPRRIWTELFLTEGGLIAGHPGTRRGLEALLDFLPGSAECVWAVGCYGGSLLDVAEYAIERGGHVAVGLGDFAYPDLGSGWPSNAEVVAAIVEIGRRKGREIASPKEVRALLGIAT